MGVMLLMDKMPTHHNAYYGGVDFDTVSVEFWLFWAEHINFEIFFLYFVFFYELVDEFL